MTTLRLIVLTLLLSPVALAQTISFEGSTAVIASGLAPGTTTVWMAVQVVPMGGSFAVTHRANVVADTNNDGVVRWEIPNGVGSSGIYTMVDMTSHNVITVDRGANPVAGGALPEAAFVRDSLGDYSTLVLPGCCQSDILWVRPGVGAWYGSADDRNSNDLDHVINDLVVFPTSTMFGLEVNTAPRPNGFAAGDILVRIGNRAGGQLSWYGGEVTASHLAAALNPGTVSFASMTQNTTNENLFMASLYVIRLNGWGNTATVKYTTDDDTALAGENYTHTEGTLTFDPGEVVKKIDVPIIDNAAYSGAMPRFYVKLSYAQGMTLSGRSQESVGISENDPAPTLVVAPMSVSEGDAGTTSIPVEVNIIDGAFARAWDFTWTWSQGGGPVAQTGAVTFQPGETKKIITIQYPGDTLPEQGVNLQFSIFAGSIYATGNVQILDDDPAVITSPDRAISEVTPNLGVILTLNGPPDGPVSVKYETMDGTATAHQDYAPVSGTAEFSAGTAFIPVPLLGDTNVEGNETFKIRLFDPVNATLGTAVITITIVDDEPAPSQPALSIEDAAVIEDAGAGEIIVRVSVPPTQPLSFRLKTNAGGSALPGVDFIPFDVAEVFPAGAIEMRFSMNVVDDDIVENDEELTLTISDAVNATINRASATMTIIDDDGRVQVSSSNVTVAEGNSGTSNATFTVTLSQTVATPFRVDYSTADVTATRGVDYTAVSGQLVFAPGETTRTITVPIAGDTIVEQDEVFELRLSVDGASLAAVRATIKNDDLASKPRKRAVRH